MQDGLASGEDICAAISSLPCQLSAEDIDDFFSLAQYYAARTPQSFRKVRCPAEICNREISGPGRALGLPT